MPRQRTRTDIPTGASIRLLGTTWLRRGSDYWLRRAGVTFLVLLPAVAMVGILVLVLQAMRGRSTVAFAVGCVLVVAAAGVTGWRAWHAPARGSADRPARRYRRQGRMVFALGLAATTVLALLILLAPRVFAVVLLAGLTLLAAATAGPMLVALARTLGRELPAERETRTRLGPTAGTATQPTQDA